MSSFSSENNLANLSSSSPHRHLTRSESGKSEKQLVNSPSTHRRLKSVESVDGHWKDPAPGRHGFGSFSSDSPSSAMMHNRGKNMSILSSRSGSSGADDNNRVFNLIGRMHELSAYEDETPPKIVVIGNHMSGKSSLLAGLTGLSFPSSPVFRTRFATQVTLRNTPGEFPSVTAYIVPGRTSTMSGSTSNILVRSTSFISKTAFDSTDFPQILEKAAKQMELFPENPDKRFCDDLLMVDISGPDYDDLRVVDLPGLSYNPTVLQPISDIYLIRDMILEFISDPRNIIVPVIDATQYFHPQDAVHMAREADPAGIRTVGVITKCNLVQLVSKPEIVALVNNEIHALHHGWYVVKQMSEEDADFFEDYWNEISESLVGMESLRACIKRISNQHARGYLMGFIKEIHDIREELETSLIDTAPAENENSGEASMTMKRFEESHEVNGKVPGEIETTSLENFETEIRPQFDEKMTEEPFHSETRPEYDEKTGEPLPTVLRPEYNEKTDGILQSSGTRNDELDIESGREKERPIYLINSIMVACTLALVLTLMGLGARDLAQEVMIDHTYKRLALLIVVPPQIFISLFFAQAIIGNLTQIFGPVGQMRTNSKYYSAVAPPRLNAKNGPLPHVTIQCPVYKESLDAVIRPTIESLEKAIRTYESQGGTVNLFYNDDGMQLLSPEQREERKAFYVEHNIGWVARPKHIEEPQEGEIRFIRKGKFKKASNMNYALMISNRVEEKLWNISRPDGWTVGDEEEASERCLAEVLEEEGRAWAAGDIRVGDYILLIDSDTRVPEDCLLDAVSEMEQEQRIGILQFSSGVMNVTTSFFEMGITFFTHLVYTSIRFAVSTGDVSPFVGHNAMLRWSALQETSFYEDDEDSGYEKFWSESHVSEDFDMALRLQTTGYLVRLSAYTNDEFKEGVSLTVYDELARWEKYAYGCNELLFHPFKLWLSKGIFTPLFIRFVFSNMPLGSKFTIMAYIGTYYAIGFAWMSTLLNYFLIGWLNGYLDHFYVDSFKIYVSIIVVFTAVGNVSLAVVRYRAEGRHLLGSLFENFKWIPLLITFLGGISLHVSQALLCHLLSIDKSWGATSKEAENTTFFVELPKLFYQFKFTFMFCIACTVLMICGATVFPPFWRIDFFTAIWPLVTVVSSHFFLPVLLNPALMKFTY